MPIERSAASPSPARARGGAIRDLLGRRGGVLSSERMFFTERLALLLETGSPLHTALETLERQAGSQPVREMTRRLVSDVSEGLPFSQALARQPDVFPRTYASLVVAAERGGFLPEVLQRLCEMDEKRRELNSELWSAFAYPAFLSIFSLAVVVFILVVVFPKFADLFESIRDQLPATTLVLMATSDLLRHYWAAGLIALAGAAALGSRWLARPEAKERVDRLALRLPLVRDILVQFQIVQFTRIMSLSLGNGVALLEALRSCRDIVPGARFRRFVEELETRVNEGGGIASGFRSAEFLPELVPQMVATGEESGKLALVMERLADFYEREWRKRLAVFAKIAEPAMLLIMGVVVGLIVSSLILPIFKLARVAH